MSVSTTHLSLGARLKEAILRASEGLHKKLFVHGASKIRSFQSISDLNGAIACLADWGQKISCEFFEIKMKKF